MKTFPLLSILAGVLVTAGFAAQPGSAVKTPDNVTVIFQDADKFTDVLENNSNTTSTYYLDQLRDVLIKTAAPLLAPGQKLAITVTDIDLAGETRFNQPSQIRVIKDVYVPRAELKFQLLGADGKVVKEGTRKLSDLNYQTRLRGIGSDQPLYYDKLLLKEWVQSEFKPKS